MDKESAESLSKFSYFCSLDDKDPRFTVNNEIKIIGSLIEDSFAGVRFERPFKAKSENIMQLMPGTEYTSYISYYLY